MANEEFQHILRIQNTNVDGKQKVMFALTSIKGIGRRFANIICKKADVDMNKRSAASFSVPFSAFSFPDRFGNFCFLCLIVVSVCFQMGLFFPVSFGVCL